MNVRRARLIAVATAIVMVGLGSMASATSRALAVATPTTTPTPTPIPIGDVDPAVTVIPSGTGVPVEDPGLPQTTTTVSAAMTESAAATTTSAPAADGAPTTSGPSLSLDISDVHPGDHVNLSMTGFDAQWANVTMCGNDAARGSVDCNMAESKGVHIHQDLATTVGIIPIVVPPTTCPCVLRVTSGDLNQIATIPIDLIDQPIGPVVGAVIPQTPIAVKISAASDPEGEIARLRSSVGGPAQFAVTVTVKNLSQTALHGFHLLATAARGSDSDIVPMDFDAITEIGVGQTWTQTLRVKVPSPSYGDITWHVDVTGPGGTTSAHSSTNHRPTLLYVMVLVVVLNIFLLAILALIRRRARKAEEADGDGESDDNPKGLPEGPPGGGRPIDVDSRELVDV